MKLVTIGKAETFSAITKKNQALVNKAVSWLQKYDSLNDLRSIAEDNDNYKELKKLDRACENAYDKYLEYSSQLPKREVERIEKLFW